MRETNMLCATPAALGTWLRVMTYCCERENGGVISGGASWSDRHWMAACNVTLAEIREAAPLITMKGDNVAVANYPADKEAEIQGKRQQAAKNASKGGRPKKHGEKPTSVSAGKPTTSAEEKPTLETKEKPTLVSENKPTLVSVRKPEGEREEEKEGELEQEVEQERNAVSPAGDECMAEEIYRAYPLKVGKPLAILKIKKALKEPADGFSGQEWPQELLEITKRFAKARSGEDNGFTPHPSTWFNQRRFEDDPETWRRNAASNGYTAPQASRERAIQTTPMEDTGESALGPLVEKMRRGMEITAAKLNGTYVPTAEDMNPFEDINDPRDD